MNAEKFAELSTLYRKHLRICVDMHPTWYIWSNGDKEKVDEIADKMMSALVKGTMSISDSLALKGVCKELGIKRTSKAIKAFLEIG